MQKKQNLKPLDASKALPSLSAKDLAGMLRCVCDFRKVMGIGGMGTHAQLLRRRSPQL